MALVIFTDKNKALVYSVPYLEHLHTLSLPDIEMYNSCVVVSWPSLPFFTIPGIGPSALMLQETS
jgi:hypothetical protein